MWHTEQYELLENVNLISNAVANLLSNGKSS